MSENFDELGEFGDKIKKIIDTAVSTKDYRQMTEDIKQTVGQTVNNAVNSAVDSGSEAIRNGLNNVFGSQKQGTYQNKTKEFEERRRREREQEEQKRLENEKAKERMLTLYEKNTGGRMKGLMLSISGGILASGMGLGTLVLAIFGAVGHMSSLVFGGTCFMAAGALTGAGLLAGGLKKLGKLERFQKYIGTLGVHTYCNFEQLSVAVNLVLLHNLLIGAQTVAGCRKTAQTRNIANAGMSRSNQLLNASFYDFRILHADCIVARIIRKRPVNENNRKSVREHVLQVRKALTG